MHLLRIGEQFLTIIRIFLSKEARKMQNARSHCSGEFHIRLFAVGTGVLDGPKNVYLLTFEKIIL